MSLALVDASTWIEGFDFTTRMNEISLDSSFEGLDDTRFGTAGASRQGTSRIAGLEDIETELNGFWEAPVDEAVFTGLGVADQVVTHSVDGAETSTAYLYRSRKFTYEKFGEVGANTPFTVTLQGSRGGAGLVRGQVAAASQDVSATGQLGSALNLGDVSSDERVYVTVHVFTAGTSIELELESDVDSNFDSPNPQMTIGPLTAVGGTLERTVTGPKTDAWWRLNVTSVSGTFTVAAAIGIK